MDYFIIGLVSVIAIAAHVVIFRWVKFKIDEGVICEFLRNAPDDMVHGLPSMETIATGTGLAGKRVDALCARSARIAVSESGEGVRLQDA